MRETIKEVDPLITESQAIRKAALKNLNLKEVYCQPMSADGHRSKADAHDAKADKLVSGDEKDSQIIAARAHRKAADAIDAANLSTKKAEAFD